MTLVTPNPTVELLELALREKGYTCEYFELMGNSYARFTAPSGMAWLTRSAHIGYPFSSAAATRISDEKQLAYEFCASQGVRIPKTTQLNEGYEAHEITELLKEAPLVVKPHNASLSRGVTLNITTAQELQIATKEALLLSPVVLVQEQIEGEELRFTVVNGEVKAVLLRQMPRLIGDGTSTIEQLLAIENEARSKLEMPYITYPQLPRIKITDAGRKFDEILKADEVLLLGRGTMVRTGASIYNVLEGVHPSYIETVTRLVKSLGARFIVVDLMIQDYTKPQTQDNYAFIEFNKAPVLKLFYSCRDGKHYDILGDLVPMIDAALAGVDK